MKSQSIILLLFPLTLALIPTNEQNRLKKREITEYDVRVAALRPSPLTDLSFS